MKEKNKKEIFVILPETKCWYGVKITKNTKLEFKNEFVNQKIENLVLTSRTEQKTDEFESTVYLKVNLKEGDILLLEEEKRGYFLPRDIPVGTIDEAYKELDFLKEQISKIKE